MPQNSNLTNALPKPLKALPSPKKFDKAKKEAEKANKAKEREENKARRDREKLEKNRAENLKNAKKAEDVYQKQQSAKVKKDAQIKYEQAKKAKTEPNNIDQKAEPKISKMSPDTEAENLNKIRKNRAEKAKKDEENANKKEFEGIKKTIQMRAAQAKKNATKKSISNKLHRLVHRITRPEFGKYGKNLKTADDVIAYYGHGLANLLGSGEKKKEKKLFKYKSGVGSGSYSQTFKTKKQQPVKALPAPKQNKMLSGPKPMKALPAPKQNKMLSGPKPMKALPAPKQNKMMGEPKQVKALPAPKSTAVGRPLPMQKRLPSKEKIIGSGSSYAAKTQGMPTPKKALPSPQKRLSTLECVAGNKAIEAYKEKLYEYSMKQFGSDASDAARGFAKGITFGASDNIEAGAKSLVKGTSYKSELNKAKQANASAEKRSPTLYGAGELAGSVASPVPGAAAIKGISAATKLGKAAKIGARIGSSMATQSAVDKVKSITEPKIGTMVTPSKPKPMFKSPVTRPNISKPVFKPAKFGN
jgi:hypothetical protein